MLSSQITLHEFGTRLHELVSPAQPIQSIEHLIGRSSELSRIEKALFAPGRHIFIYGDRGVGKSSLAATAANQLQSSDAKYIDVSCAPDATLQTVVANIGYQAMNTSRVRKTKHSTTASLGLRYLNIGQSSETTISDLHLEVRSLLDAVEILREVAAIHSNRPIVVLDEFDRMKNPNERNMFADLVKHLGDKKVDIRFIFTGVGRTLEELLGAHQSAIRQFETIELEKLSWDARWDIAINAANAFNLELSEDIYIRIAAISDGYPYYVHLITEKLLWRVFEDPKSVTHITWDHFHDALRDAVESINAELRRPYEMAVNQTTDESGIGSDEYEEVLWSTADSEYLHRHMKDMFSSYEYLMGRRTGRTAVDYQAYIDILRKLKNKSCGQILISSWYKKPGLMTYRENMLRGYVRMQAEAHGIQLVGEQLAIPKPQVHVPSSAGKTYHGPSVPKNVHFGRKRDR